MKIAVMGRGGHSKVIQDLITLNGECEIVAYLDDQYKELKRESNLFTGPVSMAKALRDHFEEVKFVIAIGNNAIRKRIAHTTGIPIDQYATLIHPSANISPNAKLGYGTVIMAHTVINSDVFIGNHAIVNTCSVIEHDSRIGHFVHISPNATLTGSVHVGEGAHIGAGATIIPNTDIGAWSVIGAGAAVINAIPPYSTAVGVPAMVKKQTELRALQ
jgi:acetyltransferase EpsM